MFMKFDQREFSEFQLYTHRQNKNTHLFKPFEITCNNERLFYSLAVIKIIFPVHFTELIYFLFFVDSICACRNTYGLRDACVL